MTEKEQPKRFRHPINMIDKFYLAVHEISHTMIFLADFEVRGEVTSETFREACLILFKQLPVLRSVIRGKEGWFRRLWWEELETDGAELIEYLDFFQDGSRSEEEADALYKEAYVTFSNTTWDIRKEPPIKIKLARRGRDHWSLFFLIHHSVSDGHGTRGILQIFGMNYTLLAAGKRPSEDPIPQARRSYFKFVLRTPPWRLLSTFFAYMRYEWQNHPRATTPFLLEWKQKQGTIRAVDLILHQSVTRKLVERVRELGITLNEAMILACTRNVAKWIHRQGRKPEKISIAVPVNMRHYLNLDATESVANCTVTMNINLRASLVKNIAKMIKTIRFQSFGLKRLRFPIVGIFQTAMMSWIPSGFLKKMMARAIETGTAARNTATLVYSNIGNLFVDDKGESFLIPLGDKAVVEWLRFSNPIAYPVAAAMATLTYGGKILISLSYLDPVLEKRTMEEFLTGFQEELFSVMDEKELMDKPLPPFKQIIGKVEAEEIISLRD